MLNISFPNTDKTIEKKLETLLLKTVDGKQVKAIYNAIDTKKYHNVFSYVPDINPLDPKKQRLSSNFGERYHPIQKRKKFHAGVDIAGKKGTAIHASASGRIVLVSQTNEGYGYHIKIQHKYGFITLYAHMSKILCKGGQYVKKGDIIGLVGSTGNSTGPHLHYEIHKNGKIINPKPFLFLN